MLCLQAYLEICFLDVPKCEEHFRISLRLSFDVLFKRKVKAVLQSKQKSLNKT